MTQEHGCKIMEDKTPPMGAMPVQLHGNASGVEQNTDNIETATEAEYAYYLVSEQDGHQTEIIKFPFIIGRLSTCDLYVPNKKVSREHALILKVKNALVITNENSLNGILVNNHKVKRVVLQDGDEIIIADQKYTFDVQRLENKQPNKLDGPDEVLDGQYQLEDPAVMSDSEHTQEEYDTESSPLPLTDKKQYNRNLTRVGLIGLLVTVLAIFAYQQYKKRSTDARVFVVSDKKNQQEKQADTTSTTESSVVEAEKTKDTAEPVQIADNIISKPLITKKTKSEKLSVTESKNKATPRISKKTKPKLTSKPRNRLLIEQSNSQQEISSSLNLYHAGRFGESHVGLMAIESNKRHHPEFRLQASKLREQITELNGYYETGNNAFAANSKNEAFESWEKLLTTHKRYFPAKQSYYVEEIKDKVASEYEQRGNQAYVNEEWKKAYSNWNNAIAIRPKEAIETSISLMDAEIRDLYRTGYRYETANISRAVEYWEKVVQKAPNGHEYYIKAAAKLQWYQNRR